MSKFCSFSSNQFAQNDALEYALGNGFQAFFSLKPTVKECKMQDNVEISHPFSMKNLGFSLRNGKLFIWSSQNYISVKMKYYFVQVKSCFRISKAKKLFKKHREHASQTLHQKRMDFLFYLGRL